MNKNDFNRFIGAGVVPGGADLEGARELTGLFPWFHSAHLVLLRGLRESSDIKFESQLKGSALYVADRSMLYHYLFLNVQQSTESVPVGTPGPVQVVEISEPDREPEIETPEPGKIAGVTEEITDTLPEEHDHVKEITETSPLGNIEPTVPEQIPETPETVIAEVADQEELNPVEPDQEELQQDTLPLPEPTQQEPQQDTLPLPEPPQQEQQQDTLPLPEPPQGEPIQEESREEEQNAEDTSLKTRDELIAEIEARLGEIEKEDLLELAEGDEITVYSVPEEGPSEPAEPDEISIDSVAGESIEDSNTATEETPGPEIPPKQLSPNDLIDRFIQTNPRIERMVPGEVPLLMDLTERRTEEHTPFITETLARIYVNQGYYTRAINIYEKLTLQFPEKSAYFASRIEKIKELLK